MQRRPGSTQVRTLFLVAALLAFPAWGQVISKPLRFLPEVPTMGEAGNRDVVVQAWPGFLAPARTPEVGQNMEKFGMEPSSSSPAAFASTIKTDIERWAPIVKASGFTAED